eukprot:gene1899-2233_t
MGFNIIVFFVNLAILFLMMGAFLWLVVAYAANLSIRGGVKISGDLGTDPQEQFNLAHKNYTTVVSTYNKQLKTAPVCVRNTTWLKGINESISSILAPPRDSNGTNNTLLCPQTCLNMGSFATLFKLSQNCICDQEQLFALQKHSAVVSTDAGVALGGSILIYLACCCLHGYLVSQYVHAGYEYDEALKQWNEEQWRRRRRKHAHGSHSSIAARAAGPHSSFKRPPGPGPGPDSAAGSSRGLAHPAGGYSSRAGSSIIANGSLRGLAACSVDQYDIITTGGRGVDEEMGAVTGSHSFKNDNNGYPVTDEPSSDDSCRQGCSDVWATAALPGSAGMVAPGDGIATLPAVNGYNARHFAGLEAAASAPAQCQNGPASLTAAASHRLSGGSSMSPRSSGHERAVGASSFAHRRHESHSSGGSTRELLLGAVPLDPLVAVPSSLKVLQAAVSLDRSAPGSTPLTTPKPSSFGASSSSIFTNAGAGPGANLNFTGVLTPLAAAGNRQAGVAAGPLLSFNSFGSSHSATGSASGPATPAADMTPFSSGLSGLAGGPVPQGSGSFQAPPALGSPGRYGFGYSGGDILGSSCVVGSGGFGSGLPPTIPETSPAGHYSSCSDSSGAWPLGSPLGAAGGFAGEHYTPAGALGSSGADDVVSPLERRRSGYRSSMRKGLLAYDQYKHRQRYQQELAAPLDPRTELSRRYRNRVPPV